MFRFGTGAALVALAITSSGAAYAASDADLADIRKQIELLNQRHREDEQRIQELEKRLEQAETATKAASDEAKQASAAASGAAAPPPAAPASPNAFNPAISGVLDGKFGVFSRDPEKYSLAG